MSDSDTWEAHQPRAFLAAKARTMVARLAVILLLYGTVGSSAGTSSLVDVRSLSEKHFRSRSPGSSPAAWTCKLFNCTCAGLADFYGVHPAHGFGCAPVEAQRWWVGAQCTATASCGPCAGTGCVAGNPCFVPGCAVGAFECRKLANGSVPGQPAPPPPGEAPEAGHCPFSAATPGAVVSGEAGAAICPPLSALRRWQSLKFGLFISWSASSQIGATESWPLNWDTACSWGNPNLCAPKNCTECTHDDMTKYRLRNNALRFGGRHHVGCAIIMNAGICRVG